MWNLCTESMCFPLRYDCHELRPRLERRNVTMGPHKREDKVGSPSPLPFGNVVCRTAASVGTGSYILITTLFGFPGEKKVKSLSPVRLFATPGTVACQAPLSMAFSRQASWSGLPYPSPGDLPGPGIEPVSPALQADALPSEPPGKLVVKKPPASETQVRSLGGENPLEEGMAPHSSLLAWRMSMDRGVWQATVPGVAKSRTGLSKLSMLAHSLPCGQHARICTSSPCLGEF